MVFAIRFVNVGKRSKVGGTYRDTLKDGFALRSLRIHGFVRKSLRIFLPFLKGFLRLMRTLTCVSFFLSALFCCGEGSFCGVGAHLCPFFLSLFTILPSFFFSLLCKN